jgi:hypothetical protein
MNTERKKLLALCLHEMSNLTGSEHENLNAYPESTLLVWYLYEMNSVDSNLEKRHNPTGKPYINGLKAIHEIDSV